MSSSVITRRTILGLAGVGTASLLTACVQVSRSTESSASSASTSSAASSAQISSSPAASSSAASGEYNTESKDYKGIVPLVDRYEDKTYEPGTLEHPPRNAPKPLKPENMDEDSLEGAYATLRYHASVLDYITKTGDLTPLQEMGASDADINYMKTFESFYAEAETSGTWYPDPKFEMDITQNPTTSSGRITWPCTETFINGTSAVIHHEFQEDLPERYQWTRLTGRVVTEYVQGHWRITPFLSGGGTGGH